MRDTMSFRCRSLFPLLLAALILAEVQGETPVTPDAHLPAPGRPRFVCNKGYTPQNCRAEMQGLQRALAPYQPERVGDWTWILVRSEDWKEIKRRLGMNPDSPAFSVLSRRQTFLEEALVAPVPGRSAELIKNWSISLDDLLQLAVTHELGHALCNEVDEHKADAYGKLLRAGKDVRCR